MAMLGELNGMSIQIPETFCLMGHFGEHSLFLAYETSGRSVKIHCPPKRKSPNVADMFRPSLRKAMQFLCPNDRIRYLPRPSTIDKYWKIKRQVWMIRWGILLQTGCAEFGGKVGVNKNFSEFQKNSGSISRPEQRAMFIHSFCCYS